MVRIAIDLPIPLICLIDPLQTNYIAQEAQFCLSLAILLFFYGYLFYLYIVALRTIHSQGVFHQLDLLDVVLCAISLIRLCILFMFPFVDHISGMKWFNIFGFLWIFVILMVYIRFVVEQRRRFVEITTILALLYIIYIIYFNSIYYWDDRFCEQNRYDYRDDCVIFPFLIPSLILISLIIGIGIREFFQIEKALKQRVLTPSIIIQLKNRRSFIFQTAITCLMSFIMRVFPDIFKPILGQVLYFIFCQWVNMAIFYRCVLQRIVRNHEESESSIDQDDRLEKNKRNSNLIVIQMQQFNTR